MTERAIVGTAGHIDHGKTRLVEALTGIDCDRWVEEKDRGITIDLGFAHLESADLQIGFVDVPGHERFLHNALAGMGGIRIMMLVVAADEGVKPQTREHLAICSLLGIPASLVALTKADLVAPDLLDLARMEVEELLEASPFAGAPIVPVSSLTGEGIPELQERLFELAREHQTTVDPSRPVRLPIDRAFHLKGLGVIVTGTLVDGVARVGETLSVMPGDRSARIRSIQVHGQDRQSAEAGERTALQLSGPDLGDLARGAELVAPGAFRPTTSLVGDFQLLADAPKPIRGSQPIRFHLYASEVVGKLRPLAGPIEPGGGGPVEIKLAHPVLAVRGDRFIVRRPSPQTTLGGGRILDPQSRRRRGPALEPALTKLTEDRNAALALWVEEAGEGGIDLESLATRLGVEAQVVGEAMESLAADGKLLEVPVGRGQGRRWLATGAFRRVADRARQVLAAYFDRQRLARGIPKAEAVRRILPGQGAELAEVYLAWLQAQKILVVEGDLVNLPERSAQLTDEETGLAGRILEVYEKAGLKPPSPQEVKSQLDAKPQVIDGVIRYLLERDRLHRLSGDLLIAGAAIDNVARDLQADAAAGFSVPEFKERYGLSRKWAIPILEHLDSRGITRRVGDRRQVVGKS